jgi:hypothetical protein
VKIRFNSTDELTFQQVFLNKEYDISRLRQYQQISETYHKLLAAERLPIIIDAGANVGWHGVNLVCNGVPQSPGFGAGAGSWKRGYVSGKYRKIYECESCRGRN